MTGVTQGDREAAATYLERTRNMPCHYSDMREGSEDDHRLVQAFAAHRITALEEAAKVCDESRSRITRRARNEGLSRRERSRCSHYAQALEEQATAIRNLKGAGA